MVLLILVASYDIACQWKCNLESQIKQFPKYLQLDLVVTAIRYLIPKFHLPGHGLTCQSHFSHSLAPGVGRMDGEGIEQDWSWINPAATSTKQMGPGARHDTLDDHWGDMNWCETVMTHSTPGPDPVPVPARPRTDPQRFIADTLHVTSCHMTPSPPVVRLRMTCASASWNTWPLEVHAGFPTCPIDHHIV